MENRKEISTVTKEGKNPIHSGMIFGRDGEGGAVAPTYLILGVPQLDAALPPRDDWLRPRPDGLALDFVDCLRREWTVFSFELDPERSHCNRTTKLECSSLKFTGLPPFFRGAEPGEEGVASQ